MTPRVLTEAQRAAAFELHKRKIRTDPIYWAKVGIRHFQPPGANFAPAVCHELLLQKLWRVAEGTTKNLMVFMPSGSGKTTYLSKIFPAWLMATQPMVNVIAASHTIDFAEKVSGDVQALLSQYGGQLGAKPETWNRKDWKADNGSSYRATGVGGSVLGERGDYGFIDDPFGGFEDANSPVIRDKVYNWYRGDFVTRLKPGARTILMHQRVHLDDLAGRLLQEEPDDWEVLFLPAIWEGENWNGEPLEHDELGRSVGGLLWPEYHTEEFLETVRKRVGPQSWASMYQQRPVPAGGALFHAKKLSSNRLPLDELPSPKKFVRGWDTAATKKGDWTVGVLMMRGVDDRYYVVDVVRTRGGPEEVRALIQHTAARDAEAFGRVHISLPKDPGAGGIWMVNDLTKALAGYVVESSPETGDKADRARPFAAQVNGSNVSMVEGPWNYPFLEEMSVFPGGKYDDQIDASSRAFAGLIELPPVYRRPTFGNHNLFSR